MTINSKLLFAVSAIASLVLAQQFVELPWNNTLTIAMNNWLHVFLFTSITVLVRWSLPKLPLSWVLIIACLLALATEAAQWLTGGSPSFVDIGRDLLGVAIACPVFTTLTRARIACALAISIVVTLMYPATILASYLAREARFPTLYEANVWDRWLISNSNSQVRQASTGLTHIVWAETTWPGFHLPEPVQDWRNYRYIVAKVSNPGEPQPLTIAVRHKGRSGTAAFVSSELSQGNNLVRVDLDRLAQTPNGQSAQIVHIMLHTHRAYAGRDIYLDRVYLE